MSEPQTFDSPPSREFLAELLYRARRIGWGGDFGDYTEVAAFVRQLHREAGVVLPPDDLEPFDCDDEQ